MQNDTQTEASVLKDISSYLARSAQQTVLCFLGIAVICFIFTAVLVVSAQNGTGGDIAGYIFLSFIGYAVYLGQLSALSRIGETVDRESITEAIVTVVTVIYYNAMVLVSAIIGLVLGSAGNPDLAIAVAFGLPIADMWLSRNHFGFASLAMRVAIAVGERGVALQKSDTLRKMGRLPIQFLAWLEDILPTLEVYSTPRTIQQRRKRLQ